MARAILSNSARVITVWQPAPDNLSGFDASLGHNPLMVMTGASSATLAADGGGGTGLSSSAAPGSLPARSGASGFPCPQARTPNRKTISQPLHILKNTSKHLI